MANRKKIAAIVTTYFPYSHSDLIVSKFVSGFPIEESGKILAAGKVPRPGVPIDFGGSPVDFYKNK